MTAKPPCPWAVSSLINPNQRGEVLKYSINLTRGRYFIVGEELLPAFEEIKPGLNLSDEDSLYFQPEHHKDLEPEGYINLERVLTDQPVANPSTTGEITVSDPQTSPILPNSNMDNGEMVIHP